MDGAKDGGCDSSQSREVEGRVGNLGMGKRETRGQAWVRIEKRLQSGLGNVVSCEGEVRVEMRWKAGLIRKIISHPKSKSVKCLFEDLLSGSKIPQALFLLSFLFPLLVLDFLGQF